jgi:putative component of toxin-antitoxin plasmid stabilization module
MNTKIQSIGRGGSFALTEGICGLGFQEGVFLRIYYTLKGGVLVV